MYGECMDGKVSEKGASRSMKKNLRIDPFCIGYDKELTLHILHLNCIPTMELITEKTDIYPIVGRMHGYNQGKDLAIVDSQDQAREEGYDFFTKLYVIEKEYRLEVEALSVTKIEEATPDRVTHHEIPIRTQSFGWKWKEIDLNGLPTAWKELAIRSVYVTGMAKGFVKIGKLINDSPIVISVKPKECTFSITPIATHLPFTIGADVEFMLNNEGELIPASRFFPVEGPVGCDERQIEQDSGDYALAEIRPEKAHTPQELYKNIRTLLNEASSKIPYNNIKFHSGSMPFSGYQCGGHLHFGTPLSLSKIHALDQYVAIPMSMIEDSRTAKRRRKTKHGGLGKFRIQPYGFEYISLSSWITDPKLTLGILCLAYLVVAFHHELPADLLFEPLVQQAYYNGNKTILKHYWPEIKKRIQGTTGFHIYEEELSDLFHRIEHPEDYLVNQDLRQNWELHIEQQPYLPETTIHIPKKIRKQLHLKEGQSAFIRAGKSFTTATIHPYPFSFRDSNIIQLSQPLRDSLSLPKEWNPKIFQKNGILALGPIMGILAPNPLGLQETYFNLLCRLGKEKRMLVYYFDPANINWDKKVIHGISIYGEGEFPFPDVIYDRLFLSYNTNKQELDQMRLKFIHVYNIQFINSPTLFELTGNKWETHTLLSEDLKENLPETRLLEHPSEVIEMLNVYGELFLKPINGAAGEGIIHILRTTSGMVWFYSNGKEIQHKGEEKKLTKFINSRMKRNTFIMQEGISRKKLNDFNVEIRIYMQKNGRNQWMRTGMVSRLTKSGVVTENTEVNMKITNVLNNLYPDSNEKKNIRNQLGLLSKNVIESVEEHVGDFGEIAIDVCIDQYNNLKIIEINAKPDNLFATIKAFKRRTLAGNRLLNYASYLAGYDADPL